MYSKSLNWVLVKKEMPNKETCLIVCKIQNGDSVEDYTSDVQCCEDESGCLVLLNNNFESLPFEPTHWAYLDFPYDDL